MCACQVLVIGPGFGFLANPEQIRIIERAGFITKRLLAPNPEESGFSMSKEIGPVLKAIEEFEPDAILCASKVACPAHPNLIVIR